MASVIVLFLRSVIFSLVLFELQAQRTSLAHRVGFSGLIYMCVAAGNVQTTLEPGHVVSK